MHVHIASIFKADEPIKKGIAAAGDVDEVYLLTASESKEAVEKVEKYCKESGYVCHSIEIDQYNYMQLILTIRDIYNKNYQKGTRFTINITGGTKVQAAAACVAAHFISADMLYIIDDRLIGKDLSFSESVVWIPAPPKVLPEDLSDEERKLLGILLKESQPGTVITNQYIADNYYKVGDKDRKANTSYHLNKLEGKGLIRYEDRTTKEVPEGRKRPRRKNSKRTDKRYKPLELTEMGEIYARWIGEEPARY